MSNKKSLLHPRNKHQGRYDLKRLSEQSPELETHIHTNKYGNESIDFANPKAVKALNGALLKTFYDLEYWDIPEQFLCPPVPGRADYIHYIADVLATSNLGKIPKGKNIKVLDIGVGANCIYPIIGTKEYNWSFVGTEIHSNAVTAAQEIINRNSALQDVVEIRLQKNPTSILKSIIQKDEYFDCTICNPPFHASLAEAQAASLRKLNNLNAKKVTNPTLNFGGQHQELYCEGGEVQFIKTMMKESKAYAQSCFWFTSLVSQKSKLPVLQKILEQVKPSSTKIVEMGQGNKISRFIAWTFLTSKQQENWAKLRWE